MLRFPSIVMWLAFAWPSMLEGAKREIERTYGTFRADWEGACPFCTLPIAFDASDCASVHKLPMCNAFEELDPIFFARYVRLHMEGKPGEAAELMRFS